MIARARLLPWLIALSAATALAVAAPRQTEALSRGVYDALQRAQQAVAQQQYANALQRLEQLHQRRGLSGYESSQIWHLAAYVHYLRGDYRAALDAYQRVLEYPRLAEAIRNSTLRTVARLHVELGEHRQAIDAARRLLQLLEAPEAEMLILIAQSHYQLDEFDAAALPARQAVRLAERRNGRADENWYLLLQALHHRRGDDQALADVLRRLVRHYPRPSYLRTLAGVYGNLGQSRRQLALLRSLYDGGQLEDEAGILTLVQLQLSLDAPFHAAEVLQRALDGGSVQRSARSLRLLAQAWRLAREPQRALAPLRQALSLAADDELQLVLGHTYLQLQRWADAEAALREAVDSVDAARAGEAWLMLGTAQFRNGSHAAAVESFRRAQRYRTAAPAAQRWLAYLQSHVAAGQ